jgi:hypothetical protein
MDAANKSDQDAKVKAANKSDRDNKAKVATMQTWPTPQPRLP